MAAVGARVRVVDRALDRVHESRALAIQPRTLEVLASLGVSDEMVAAGSAPRRWPSPSHREESGMWQMIFMTISRSPLNGPFGLTSNSEASATA
ncbi:FAD-dependent monooxygenase [Micromonospora cremea]|uniref:FAD-dependent monooxygenase n=1 Tax=Micromonospora cremea TaxID=709881 RepID=UPI0009415A98